MKIFKVIILVVAMFTFSSINACKYTIREIGFSTLSKVTYVLYRVNENSTFFPNQLEQNFSESNVKVFGLTASDDDSAIVKFAKSQKLSFPAYVLAAPDGRMIAISGAKLEKRILHSSVQSQLVAEMATSYAAVILVESNDDIKNEMARVKISKACTQVANLIPNMPKQVAIGPKLISISTENFEEEKVMLWSLGVNKIPDEPVAFVVYGKGRIMGKKINYVKISGDHVYKLLSIIGADCECGLDRKWMLGYQMPLDWPKDTRQILADELGFDVDNPMVLTEMSRILAIENKVAMDPSGVSFEPVVFDLEKEFDDVPEVKQESKKVTEEGVNSGRMILYSAIVFILITAVGAIFILKRKT